MPSRHTQSNTVQSHIATSARRSNPKTAATGTLIADGAWLLARGLILLIIAVAPWAFGAVDAWAEELLGTLLVSASCLWLLGLSLRNYNALVLPVAVLPFVLFISWGLLQLLPLERTWLILLSPASVAVREQLVGPIESAATLSLYPAATRYQIARSLMILGMFFLGAQLFYRRKHQQSLCLVAAINGLALAYFGLYQHVTGTDLIYWCFRPTDGATFFGPFANRNNAGCYLNLSLAAGMALFLNASSWQHAGQSRSAVMDESLAQRLLAHPAEILRRFAGLGQKKLVILGLIALMAMGVVVSSSRTALLALIASCMATWCVARLQPQGKSSLVGWGTLISLIVVWFCAADFLDEAARTKLNSLKDPEQLLRDGRLEHWPSALAAARDYWLTGSGLGTYRFVYRLFETGPTTVWFQHAENEYLETLVETGVVGISILAVGLLLVARCGYRLGLQRHDPWSRALALALAFVLAGQAVHALFDFGLSLTANALLFALLLGSATGRDTNLNHVKPAEASTRDKHLGWRRLANITGGLVTLCASLMAVTEIARRADMDAALRGPWVEHMTEQSASSKPDAGSLLKLDPESRELARIQLAYALRDCPDDAEGHLALARALIDEYRLVGLNMLNKETHGQINLQSLQSLATLSTLRQRAHMLLESQLLTEREQLLHAPLVTTWLIPALAHLQAARSSCPLLPDVHWQLAQLSFLTPTEPSGSQQLERVRLLASGSAAFWYWQGQVALELKHSSDALASWQRSLALSLQYQSEILPLAEKLYSPDQVVSLLPDDPWNLLRLQAECGSAVERASFKQLLSQRIETNLASIQPKTADQWYRLSQFNMERGRITEAGEQLKHAVNHAPDNTSFRYQYAKLLWDTGRSAEARTQAAICLAKQPSHKAAEDLLERILAR